MGSFSLWHWIIVLVVLGIPAVIIGLIVLLSTHAKRKPN